MRDPQRIDRVLGVLRAVWEQAPDLRLGQIVEHLATGKDDCEDVLPVFYIEDDELLKRLKERARNGW